MRYGILGVAAVLLASPAALAQYCDGHVWNRSDDFTAGAAAGFGWGRGNPDKDSIGSPVWSVEWVQGVGLDGTIADQWFRQAPTLLVWDNDWRLTTNKYWVRTDDVQPTVAQGWQQHWRVSGDWNYIPVARWTNLIGDGVTVDVTGSVDVRWHSAFVGASLGVDVDVMIAKYDVSSGVYTTIHSETGVAKLLAPTVDETRTFSVSETGISLDLGDQIIISHRNRAAVAEMADPAVTSLYDDDLDITYQGRTFSCRLADFNGDGLVDATDLGNLSGSWGACACP